MANCSYCNSFFLFGGLKDQTGHYCNANCQLGGNLLVESQTIPEHEIRQLVTQVHQGPCPRCHGKGPVDMHKAHRVWSILVMTSWSSSPELSCKACAVQRQVASFFTSSMLGWWGFPWGIIFTPVQLIKNVAGMLGGPSAKQPSPLLERFVRIQAAAQNHAPQAAN